ncbi:VanZ family protein, partial [Clostridium sp.]|uniref:VanZ family protein n=1 Tax=Clostridium sp. TaxID=1506 RepID=UPI0034639741
YRVLRDFLLKYAQWYSVIFSFLYAVTDEFHQTFIPGRVGSFKDVLIDTTGALICAIVITLLIAFKNKKKKSINSNL